MPSAHLLVLINAISAAIDFSIPTRDTGGPVAGKVQMNNNSQFPLYYYEDASKYPIKFAQGSNFVISFNEILTKMYKINMDEKPKKEV